MTQLDKAKNIRGSVRCGTGPLLFSLYAFVSELERSHAGLFPEKPVEVRRRGKTQFKSNFLYRFVGGIKQLLGIYNQEMSDNIEGCMA